MKNEKKNIFNVGDKIQIAKYGKKQDKIYPSQILDIIDDDTFEISGPIHKGAIIFLHAEEIIRIMYIKENKGRYMFKAKVLSREQKKIYKLRVKRISDVKRLQQRKYYRFDINIPVRKNHSIKVNRKYKDVEEECATKDISGNGMKLMCNFKHSVGDIVVCNFNIKDMNISVKSRVVRIEEIETFDFKYSIGLEFLNIEENQRDDIVKFIFEQERILRDKGLI